VKPGMPVWNYRLSAPDGLRLGNEVNDPRFVTIPSPGSVNAPRTHRGGLVGPGGLTTTHLDGLFALYKYKQTHSAAAKPEVPPSAPVNGGGATQVPPRPLLNEYGVLLSDLLEILKDECQHTTIHWAACRILVGR